MSSTRRAGLQLWSVTVRKFLPAITTLHLCSFTGTIVGQRSPPLRLPNAGRGLGTRWVWTSISMGSAVMGFEQALPRWLLRGVGEHGAAGLAGAAVNVGIEGVEGGLQLHFDVLARKPLLLQLVAAL